MKTLRLHFLLFLTVFYLAGCESVPEEPGLSVLWQSHHQRLTKLQEYQLSGKLGIISPEQRQNLNFSWKQSAESSELHLTTFLGQTVLNLTVTAQGIEAITRDGITHHNSSPEALVYELTGLILPITYMKDWIKGLPTAADQYAFNDTNTLATLNKRTGSQRWDVHYLGYQAITPTEAPPLLLPNKMQLDQGNFTLKIMISKWVLNQ